MAKLFELGQIVQTARIAEMGEQDADFYMFVLASFARYRIGDWGDTCVEDTRTNDGAVQYGERILAVYIFDKEDADNYRHSVINGTFWTPKKTEEKDPDAVKIWIITEWDRSVTTILFPNEY